MRFLSWLFVKYRARQTLRRMGRLVDEYQALVERGDKHVAVLIYEDIILLDRQLTELLDQWEAEVVRRKAVRS